jgi:hypothetical protein
MYLLPVVLTALSNVSHAANHLLDEIGERRARAAALGLVHLSGSTITHQHGGDVHTHVGGIGGLLVAAEQVDDPEEGRAPPPIELSVHAPAIVRYVLLVPSAARAFLSAHVTAAEHAVPPPLLPPPRA